MIAVEVFLASLSLFFRALRKKGSPGRTATADYMAGQAGQSLAKNFNVDIDFGEEPQPAVPARVLTSSQLQVFSSDGILLCVDLAFQAPRPYRPGYSDSEATSDDSCYRPRFPSSFRLSPSPHPEVNDMHFAHYPIQVPGVEIPQLSSSLAGFQRGFIQAKLKTLTSFFSRMGQL